MISRPRVPRRSLVLAFAFCGAFLVAAQADDWPQWRGPQRDGIWRESGISQTFSPKEVAVKWRMPVAYGFSSPVIAGGHVFVTDTDVKESTAHERVHCFDEITGKQLWTDSQEAAFPDWALSAGQEKGPIATPCFDCGKFYALGCFGRLTCYNGTNGSRLWEKDLSKEYKFPEFGTTDVSPLIDGDLLILVIGGKPGACVVALDKNSGREVWRALDDSQGYSSPVIIPAGRSRQLIVWTAQAVNALDPATGKTLWREALTTTRDGVVASPVFASDRLLLSGLMLQLASDRPFAIVLWPESRAQTRRLLSYTSTPVIQDGFVYSAAKGGELLCLRADTGEEVWRSDKVTDRHNGAAIQITPQGDTALLFNDRGELIRARLTPEGYQESARLSLIEPTARFGNRKVAWSSPAFANGCVYIRNDQEVICVSLRVHE